MNIITCTLSAINLSGGTQPRTGINEAVVAEYADAIRKGVELPPLECFWDGATRYLGDGFHRYHAHVAAGSVEVQVNQRNGTRRDAVLFAVGSNATHGLRLTSDDKRKAVRTLLEDAEWGQWSDRRIAEVTNTSPTFVGKVRESLKPSPSVHVDRCEPSAPAAPETRKVVRNGTEYEQRVKATKPAEPEPAADDGPSAGELLDELQRENEQLQATVKAAEAEDAKAEVVKWKRVADAAQRGQAEAMEYASRMEKKVEAHERMLGRLGRMIGEKDIDKVPAALENLVRRARAEA